MRARDIYQHCAPRGLGRQSSPRGFRIGVLVALDFFLGSARTTAARPVYARPRLVAVTGFFLVAAACSEVLAEHLLHLRVLTRCVCSFRGRSLFFIAR